jgi:tRNA(adenine34) deaminase
MQLLCDPSTPAHEFSHTSESGMIAAMTRVGPSRDEYFMRLALREAERAAQHDDVPIGAVIVLGDAVIGAGGNERELRNSPLAHAEMIAIERAAAHLGSWRLLDTTLYVTLEPCPMCAGAVVQARMPRLVYGATDDKAGAAGTLYNVCQDARLNHTLEVTSGVLAGESVELLRAFFRARR